MRGGAGNDVLIYDSDDFMQNGGSGEDTLRITGKGLTLNPSSLAQADAIEVLDLRGSGANAVIVDAALVTRLSDTDVLRIRGGSDELITLAATDVWVADSDIVIAGVNYAQYTFGSAAMQIEATAMRAVGSVLLLGDLNGTNGFRLDGVAQGDFSGDAVSAAGDVNGDGYDDLLIGAHSADPNGDYSGSTYVVFGRASGFGSSIELSSLDGTTGLRLDGAAANDGATAVSAAGDVNGDGYDDLLIGASFADPHGDYSGSSYLVFGRDFTGTVAQQGGSSDDNLTGSANDENFVGGLGNDVLDGGGGSDVLIGGGGNDTVVWDAADRHLDGGHGVDTLRIDGSGVTLDLGLLAKHHVTGIERIDLSGTGDNTLTIDIHDVLALPDHSDAFLDASTHQVLIDGDSGDTVHSSAQGWVQGADVSVQGTLYAS